MQSFLKIFNFPIWKFWTCHKYFSHFSPPPWFWGRTDSTPGQSKEIRESQWEAAYPFLSQQLAGLLQVLSCFIPDVWVMAQHQETLLIGKHHCGQNMQETFLGNGTTIVQPKCGTQNPSNKSDNINANWLYIQWSLLQIFYIARNFMNHNQQLKPALSTEEQAQLTPNQQ